MKTSEIDLMDLKVSHRGNAKLGESISTLSRATDISCPNSCSYLNNGCYAQRVERIYPNAKRAYEHNLQISNSQKLRSFFLASKKKGNAVRLHVNGDFMKTNSIGRKYLDVKYINDLKEAVISIGKKNMPRVWLYTHVYRKEILELAKIGIVVYASADSPSDYKEAKKVGFKLFAFASEVRKGKAETKSAMTPAGITPICWEQLGSKDSCDKCDYCIDGIGNITFLKH